MRDIFGNRFSRLFAQHFAPLCLAVGLLFCPQTSEARPRGPFPPYPESFIYHQNFDWIPYSSTNAFVPVSGVGVLVESWAGYALERAGTTVPPWTVPALDASGHTNLTCQSAGAIRFYFAPHFSSASIQGGTGPGAPAHLADLVASSASGSILDWSLQVSADGTSLQLLDYSGSSPVIVLSTPIAWPARHYRLVALDYGPQGAALFIDGQLVAQGGGTMPIPTSVGALVLGSSISGAPANGSFDEFFSFDHQLSAADVAMYYQFTGAMAAMGPISASEDAAMAAAALSAMALAPVYDLNHNTTLYPGGPVYLTNIAAALQSNGTTTITLAIGGGTNGVFYDILCATNLKNTLDNLQWPWVGQGLTCNTYSFTNQPGNVGFYMLELPQQTTVWGWGRDTAGQCDVPLGLITAQAVAAGDDFSLALLTNSTLIGWGDDTYGQTDIPSGLSNVVAIAAGPYHGVALMANGGATNWGSYWDGGSFYPVTNYPGISGLPTSNVTAIASGAGHDLILLSNGTVCCVGLTNIYPTSSNALAFQSTLSNVQAIACGWNHSVALLSNGVVKAWGLNASNLDWNLTNVPADLTNVVAIACGGLHTLALRSNGTVACFGVNFDGQTNVPAELSNVVAISAGCGWSLALLPGGSIVYWGNTNLPAAKFPSNMRGVKAISAGFQHNLAIASDGLPPLLTYPPAGFAPVGGSFTYSLTGVPVANVQYQWQFNGTNITGATNSTLTLTGVDSADAGSYQVVISNASGSATSSAATFNLAYPPQILRRTPAAPSTNWINTNITLSVGMSAIGLSAYPLSYQWQFNGTNIAAATNSFYTILRPAASNEGSYTVVITNSLGSTNMTWDLVLALPGMVEAWGSDAYGQSDRPAGLNNASAIAAGEYQSVAVTDSGSVLQWGEYSDGTNFYPVTSTNCSSPPTSGVVAVAAGLGQAIALMSDGTVSNWGLNGAWGNSVPANITNGVKAVACGDQFDLVLLTNGTVFAWGYGGTNGSLTNVPSTISNAIAIAASGQHSLVLLSNGTVIGWGCNPAGETNVPAGLSNVVAIAAGQHHNLALISTNGTVVAWGTNNFGQTNVPAGLSNVLAIAAGANHSVALSNDSVTLVEWGDNSSGQATAPASQPYTFAPFPGQVLPYLQPPVVVKAIAAGGDHTVAEILSPTLQYQINVPQDLLLIYNSTNTSLSSNVCAYYLTYRPMVGNANVLGISCATNEIIYMSNYPASFSAQINNWLAANPTKRPQYVILFQDLPSRLFDNNGYETSVQFDMNVGFNWVFQTNNYLPTWNPFVTSINMNGTNGAADCTAYIDKLVNFGSNYSPGKLVISASAGGYSNVNWYFDYADDPPTYGYTYEATTAQYGVTNVDPTASIIGTSGTILMGELYFTNFTTQATNVAAYFTAGEDGGTGDGNLFDHTNSVISFYGDSGWYIMSTIDSTSGQRNSFQAGFLSWFSTNSFGGTNYSNTPVGGITYVDEPNGGQLFNRSFYYGDWAAGLNFAISAWSFQTQQYPVNKFQAVGDPFVIR